MGDALGMHRFDEAQIVDHLRRVREQLGDMLSTLTILPEVPKRLHQLPFTLLAKRAKPNAGEVVILIMVPDQLRLVVIRVDMTRATCHKNKDHPLGPGSKHRLTLKQCRRSSRGLRLLAQPSQGQRTKSTG